MPSTDTACEGEEEVMASGRAADREDPQNSKRRVARSLDRDPISELHQGQRSDAPHQRAGHMTAPDHSAEAKLNILRRRGPSTYELCNARRHPRYLPFSRLTYRDPYLVGPHLADWRA